MPVIDKLVALQAMLAKQPADPFLLYGIAMEHKKRNEPTQAIDYFDRCIAADPNYCYAYYQRAQVQEQSGDVEGAKVTYRRGIEAASKSGDAHAREELTAALSILD
jgi:tetratricopeptide (TPR) repeat protein